MESVKRKERLPVSCACRQVTCTTLLKGRAGLCLGQAGLFRFACMWDGTLG